MMIITSSGSFVQSYYKVTADRDYDSNEIIYISYGLKSSAECLEDHGFVPEIDLDAATCELTVQIDEETDKYPDDKINILLAAGQT